MLSCVFHSTDIICIQVNFCGHIVDCCFLFLAFVTVVCSKTDVFRLISVETCESLGEFTEIRPCDIGFCPGKVLMFYTLGPLPSFSVFHEISPTDSPYYVLYNFAVPCARLFSFGRTKCYTRCRCLVKFHSGHLHRYWT